MLINFLRNRLAVIGLICMGAIAFIAIFAPWLSPYNQLSQDILNRFSAPSPDHLFGTDSFGRDIFSRVLMGSRISLMIGVLAVAMAGLSGTLLGMTAGYRRGSFDSILMKVVDTLMSLPSIVLGAIVIVAIGAGMYKVTIAISIALFPRFVRLARAPTLALKEKEFFEASKAMGASDLRIILSHIAPNILGPITVMTTLWIATAIRISASLSFLGLGAQPPTPSWGLMLKNGVNNLLMSPYQAIFPGLGIMFTVLAFNMVGDGLRDALDPKLRGV